jgi:thymidine kinase
MREGMILILALALTANAIHLNLNHDQAVDLPAGSVYLVGDNGQYISICTNCGGGAYPDSAALAATPQAWTLEVVGSQVAFKGANGKYLSRCNGCWSGGSYPDSAFVHTPDRQPWSLWTPVLQANGKYSFKSDNGKFLARCNGCVAGANNPNFAFVHEANSANSWAQWDVAYTNLPKLGTRTLQADNGGYLRLCTNCGANNAVSIEANNDANAKWVLSRVGTKLALKAANGNYLSRCNGCWRGAYPDSAFAHLSTPNEPYSQWTAVKQSNGKWTFQADTGRYLSRCNGCARSSVPNLAFVHEANPASAYSQFVLA